MRGAELRARLEQERQQAMQALERRRRIEAMQELEEKHKQEFQRKMALEQHRLELKRQQEALEA